MVICISELIYGSGVVYRYIRVFGLNAGDISL